MLAPRAAGISTAQKATRWDAPWQTSHLSTLPVAQSLHWTNNHSKTPEEALSGKDHSVCVSVILKDSQLFYGMQHYKADWDSPALVSWLLRSSLERSLLAHWFAPVQREPDTPCELLRPHNGAHWVTTIQRWCWIGWSHLGTDAELLPQLDADAKLGHLNWTQMPNWVTTIGRVLPQLDTDSESFSIALLWLGIYRY